MSDELLMSQIFKAKSKDTKAKDEQSMHIYECERKRHSRGINT